MNSLRKRRGVASVIGTMLFVVVLMAGIAALAYLSSIQTQSTQSAQEAQQLLNQKGKESLTYQALSGGTLAVANTGSSGSTIKYVILKFANGSVYQFAPNQSVSSGSLLSIPSLIPNQNCGLSSCLSKYATILNSTNAGDSVGVVTSLGNVFWEKPALAVQASTPGTTVQMAFTASGDSPFASNPVLVVDGTSYTPAQLPVTLTWFVGTKHTYSWQSLPQGTGTRVGATVTGFSQSQAATITATLPGSIAATFTTQYLLTINGGSGVTVNPSSPTGDGYYPAGTGVQITVPNVWNLVAGQSRTNLVSYSLDGGSPTSVTRSGSGNFVYSLTMNNPHTIAFNSVTQYYVTTATSVPSSGSVGALTVNYGYTGIQTISQAAQTPSLSSWSPYWTETNSCSGCGSASWPSGGSFYESVSSSSGNMYPTASSQIVQALQTQIFGIPTSGVTYTSMTFSLSVSISTYLVSYGGGSFCIWIYGTSTEQCTSSSGTLTATWSGSSQAIPSIYAQASASSISYSCGPGYTQTCYGYAVIGGSASSASWSVTYTGPVSGSTQSTSNGYSVSGETVTYTYGVGYSYPAGSSAMTWSAPWPSTETYLSNTCSSVTSTANPIAASPTSTAATCTLTTTRSGSYSFALTSPTGDGWFDSGVAVPISTSPSGPFVFSSWSASSGNLVIASSTSASTTVTMNTYGTITANYSVNQ